MTERPHWLAAAVLATLVAAWAVGLALAVAVAEPPRGPGLRLAAFPPWFAEDRALAAIVAAGARPVRPTALPGLWVVDLDAGSGPRLRAAGSWLIAADVPFGPALAGCSF